MPIKKNVKRCVGSKYKRHLTQKDIVYMELPDTHSAILGVNFCLCFIVHKPNNLPQPCLQQQTTLHARSRQVSVCRFSESSHSGNTG